MKKYIYHISLSTLFIFLFNACGDNNKGCTDPNAPNYNPNAQSSDGSCSYPSSTKKVVCFFFTDTDNNTCGTYGIDLRDQVKATNPANTYFISVHPNSTDTLFAPAGIDVAGAFNLSAYPDFGVGDQGNLLTQTAINSAIATESAETAEGSVENSYNIEGDSIIITMYGKFNTVDTGTFFVAGYVLEDNVPAIQAGIAGIYLHDDVLRASTGTSGIGTQVNNTSVSPATSFKLRLGVYLKPGWNAANLRVLTVLWRKNGSDFQYINAGD